MDESATTRAFSDNIKVITEIFKCLDDSMAVLTMGQDKLAAIRAKIEHILAVIEDGVAESPYQEIQITLNTLKRQLLLVENLRQSN